MKLLYLVTFCSLFLSCNTNKEVAVAGNPYYEGLFINEQDMDLMTKLNNGKVLGVPNVIIIKLLNDKEAIRVAEIVDKAHFQESVQNIYTKIINDKDYLEAQKKSQWIKDLTYELRSNDSIIFKEINDEYTIRYSGKISNKEMGLRMDLILPDSVKNFFTPGKDAEIKKYVFYPVKEH